LPWPLILCNAGQRESERGIAQEPVRSADSRGMSVSAASISAATQASIETDRQIAVMRKSRDVQQETGEALVNLIKQATPPMPDHVGTLVNVVA
jgi:hypothetical protein